MTVHSTGSAAAHPELRQNISPAERTARIDAGARALFVWHCRAVGRTALPSEFESLGKATREQFEVGAIRVLQAAGAL